MRTLRRYAEWPVPWWRYAWVRATSAFRRRERWPDDGVDYTGWSARLLQDVGRVLAAGSEGRVLGFDQQRQGKFWRIEFPGAEPDHWVDYMTTLPTPESVELIEPAAGYSLSTRRS